MAVQKSLFQLPVWQKAARAAADPDRVKQALEQLAQTSAAKTLASANAELARIYAALFSGSPASTAWLVKKPEWVEEWSQPEVFQHPRRIEGLRRDVNAWLKPALEQRDYATPIDRLRQFKHRDMIRIAARDLARLSDLPATTLAISDVADVCLASLLQILDQQQRERVGQPWHRDADERWQPTEFAVIGLGKHGGQELNYSSDVDVVFVYSEEGQVFKEPPTKASASATGQGMTNHQYFKRLAESFIAELTRTTPQGTLFRIDLRLRPEGDSGPLVRSLSSYETFYAQWGQAWERMMLIKARGVAGSTNLAGEFVEMVQPFRYPRSLNPTFLQEIAAMKDRLETEVVKAGEIERNVKLGRGGIREIEFVAQSFQVLHAGRIPFLQGPQTLPVLDKLVQYQYLSAADVRGLKEAYCFLRDIEHRLQMEQYLQTHTMPSIKASRERLAALMGFDKLSAFETALKRHNRHVRQVYDRCFKTEKKETPAELPGDFANEEAAWKTLLARHSFRDPEKSFRLLNEFVNGPGFGHVSTRTSQLARQMVSRLLALCPVAGAEPVGAEKGDEDQAKPRQVLSDPDRVLTRMDSFISAYGARAMLFETWAANPSLFELLLLLFDRSEFLAETAIRTPDLVDELMLSGRLSRRKTAEEVLRDLRYGHEDEDQGLWMRRYHQAEQMRIGLREILGLADWEQNLVELTALAEACLGYALEAVLRKHKIKGTPIAIIGLGKLGGQEINYGSDLDITFVAASETKNLPKLQRVAAEVMEILSQPTEMGVLFPTDARLRPDGEKGLLVNQLEAYEEYYRRRAQLWEIQALSRARFITGNTAVGAAFERLVQALTDFTPDHVTAGWPLPEVPGQTEGQGKPRRTKAKSAPRMTGLAAYTPDWMRVIARMRQRIEKERTSAGQDHLAIKTGNGGLMDAEFIAQALNLRYRWYEANTQRCLDRARDTGVIERADADLLIDHYRRLRRVECILRRWSFVGEVELPNHPAPLYRVAVRCGYPNADAFMRAVGESRRALRQVYLKVFQPSEFIHPVSLP